MCFITNQSTIIIIALSKHVWLQWLKRDFLPYLNSWEKRVTDQAFHMLRKTSCSFLKKQEMNLHLQVLNQILDTRVYTSLVYWIHFTIFIFPAWCLNLLKQPLVPGSFRKLLQATKTKGRTNYNPSSMEFLRNAQALRVINTTCNSVLGNCRCSRQHEDYTTENTPLVKRKVSII